MPARILTGTASWTDPGFIAEWYPRTLPASQRLRWYAEHFRLVEVDASFYRIPEARMVQRWCEQTPEGFVFDVKLHRLLSRHSTKPELLPHGIRERAEVKRGKVELTPRLEKAATSSFLKGIQTLKESGKLGALLLQLSPGFSPRHHRLEELDHLLECLEGYTVAVELRNRNWVTEDQLQKTMRFFTRRKIAFVTVDAPQDPHFAILPNLDLVTTRKLACLRAHGRNAQGYVRGRSVAARFDYDYPVQELEEIAERAAGAATKAQEVHVVFNNNKGDYAPRAAATFQKLLQKRSPQAAPDPERELAYA